MSYDIYMAKEPEPGLVEREGLTPQFEGQPGYWRFAGVGMAGMLTLMARADAIDLEAPPPEFPDWPPEDLGSNLEEVEDWVFGFEADDPDLSTEERRLLDPIRRAVLEVQSRLSPNPRLVPAYKFCSNDGWLVVPAECSILARSLRDAFSGSLEEGSRAASLLPSPDESGISLSEAQEWVLGWAAFNAVASGTGGYRVL